MDAFSGLRRLWLVVAMLVAILSSCASLGGAKDAESIVRERAMQRWEHLLAGELDLAYDYLSPGTRALMSAKQYKGRIRLGLWRGAKIQSVECVDNACKVNVIVEYSYRRSRFRQDGETVVSEDWVYDDGMWWHVPQH